MCMQILQILLIGHSYEQGLITKEYMIVQCNFKLALIGLYTPIATLVIHLAR